MASDNDAGTEPALRQPLLFKRLEPIDPARHAGLKLDRAGRNYRFAEGVSAVPLTLQEFAAAAANYPIVFSDGPEPMPLAVLGYRPGENLFIEPDGNWTPGFHIPWYVRCYPFAVFTARQPGSLVACLDAEGAGIGPLIGDPLLENGALSPLLQEILRFCQAYNQAIEETRALGKALEAAGLLTQHEALVALGGERPPARLAGFWAADAAKFLALPDKTFLGWRKNGLLGPVYQHLQSLNCWPSLSTAAARRLDRTAKTAAE
ncbi:MAG: hypothetical protein QOJ54_1914 [Aliidongia sp.]|nr:hypothetical protein [Aliidongia sp.]